jgi:hypothetical protein
MKTKTQPHEPSILAGAFESSIEFGVFGLILKSFRVFRTGGLFGRLATVYIYIVWAYI